MIFYKRNKNGSSSPYQNMLEDIGHYLNIYFQQRKLPSYILINSDDSKYLVKEMITAKIIPAISNPPKLQYQGIAIIRTPDISEGFFEIVWS